MRMGRLVKIDMSLKFNIQCVGQSSLNGKRSM